MTFLAPRPFQSALGCLALTFWLAAAPCHAEFAVAISPPRFELQTRPGETLRRTLEITNAASRQATYTLKTADWNYEPGGTVNFSEALSPDSCRPWVAIERRQLVAVPGRPYRFRFEVTPPAGTPPTECRFAILIEGEDEQAGAGGLSVPFNARMAVVVYLGVGNVQPQLGIVDSAIQTIDGTPTPALRVRNTGGAHGRLGGYLTGIDASDSRLDFTPADSPILPGESRWIPLNATRQGQPEVRAVPKLPVVIKGKLEWGKSESQEIDIRFAQ